MVQAAGSNAPAHLEVPKSRGPWRTLLALAFLIGLPLGLWAQWAKVKRLWRPDHSALPIVVVDRGDVPLLVVENGALISAENVTVKCKVEALIGMVGGAQGATGRQAGGAAGSPSTVSTVATAGATTTQRATTTTATTTTSTATTASTSTASTSAAATTAITTTGTAAATTDPLTPPVIESFTYVVAKYTPLRPVTATQVQTSQQIQQQQNVQQQQQRGGGGGGRGGQQQQPGSTTIIWILPEGARVKKGDKVCEFDSSAFRDELDAQKIKCFEAKSFVEQAVALLENNEQVIQEYKKGIYPRDLALIDGYIHTVEQELDKANRTYNWSRRMFDKKMRTATQLQSDYFTLQRLQVALTEAQVMRERLVKHTGPKLVGELWAKHEAIVADKLAQDAAFQLEDSRRQRLERMIANCTLTAPRDGIVVYENQVDRMGQLKTAIQEGTAVREGMPIFSVPTSDRIRVKAKINETKITLVHPGTRAMIHVEAAPEHPLTGTVAEITQVPAPANGPLSDIKVYDAMIDVEGIDPKVRPGMTTEVTFEVGLRRDVTRVPVQAIRYVDEVPFAAILTDDGPEWRELTLGRSNAIHAEVVAGLKPGDRVVAAPGELPAPVVTARKGDHVVAASDLPLE
jgi:multidrug resistance efflux pump